MFLPSFLPLLHLVGSHHTWSEHKISKFKGNVHAVSKGNSMHDNVESLARLYDKRFV